MFPEPDPVAVKITSSPGQTEIGVTTVGVVGTALTVTLCVELFEQDPVVAYVTVYVPGVEADKSITPVEALIDNPAVLEKVPPATPVIVGVGSVSFAQ